MAKDKKSSSGGASASAGRQKASQQAVPAPNVQVYGSTNEDAVERRVAKEVEMFGRELTNDDYALLVGAQEGSEVRIGISGDTLVISVRHENIVSQLREIHKDSNGDIYMSNELFSVSPKSPPGFGTKVFTDQVRGARQLGIKYIKTEAAGSAGSPIFNGYYTWPRMGYDAPIKQVFLEKIPANLRPKSANPTIQELFSTKAGREWWKENGGNTDMRFDLAPNSLSSKVLDAYNEERAAREKKG